MVEALVGLGWNLKAADDAVSTVLAEAGVDVVEAPDVAGALRAALRVLGGPRS
nr:RuvA C-terminal domain-containing protein [Cellulosimicrobium sp. MM]